MKIRAENHPEVFIKESDFLCARRSHQLLPGSAVRSCKFLLPMTLHHISEATEFFFLSIFFFFFSSSQLFTGKKSWRLIIKITTITTTEHSQKRQAEKPIGPFRVSHSLWSMALETKVCTRAAGSGFALNINSRWEQLSISISPG